MTTRWGTSRSEVVERVDTWFVGTREFVCDDGTSFWQYKVARNEQAFRDPLASAFGWASKLSPRHRKDFDSRGAARDAAKQVIGREEPQS